MCRGGSRFFFYIQAIALCCCWKLSICFDNSLWIWSGKTPTFEKRDLKTANSSCNNSTFFCSLSFSRAKILTRSSVSLVRILAFSRDFRTATLLRSRLRRYSSELRSVLFFFSTAAGAPGIVPPVPPGVELEYLPEEEVLLPNFAASWLAWLEGCCEACWPAKEIKKIVSLFSAYLYVQYGVRTSLFHLSFGSEKTYLVQDYKRVQCNLDLVTLLVSAKSVTKSHNVTKSNDFM